MRTFMSFDDFVEHIVPFSIGAVSFSLLAIGSQQAIFNQNAKDKCALAPTHRLVVVQSFFGDAYGCVKLIKWDGPGSVTDRD